ncbi:MAG: glutathione S-transferase family protein [Alphaproteobacteria bacterium]|jgi:putative glutathione S-transferase|nr:glutathione S-transferase family protein [Alphaproteobacteria bacterium]
MGIMVRGKWQQQDFAERNRKGNYVRPDTAFRHCIGEAGFPAQAGRYHLVVAHACPWAHRTLIFRALKGLEEVISVAYVEPLMLENGWELMDGGDPVTGAKYTHQIYAQAVPDYSGRCSVPVLWDKEARTIVNNESSEIIRMFNSAFDDLATKPVPDLYPEHLRAEIDAVNDVVYNNINNGVYKAGFATTQEVYESVFAALFEALDEMEARLDGQRYLTGPRITEADWRLFATLVRFDAVYVGHFKCNRQRIADYPNLSNYLRELYQWPGIAATVDIPRIKQHYYGSHTAINPFAIVPVGPDLDFHSPHDRHRLPDENG